ncbi:hypothetical protein JRQ81_012100 [Phrynocephalus forsythii]|uniref:Uncharacterized protein n=1 Tax=Phrynocephalus forsythii TaxID=171643 RepID=A0A9Q0X5A4_9SAUR|nr:hypothetical protein JRQ81_012100 [Phrynocephalus forsythii]
MEEPWIEAPRSIRLSSGTIITQAPPPLSPDGQPLGKWKWLPWDCARAPFSMTKVDFLKLTQIANTVHGFSFISEGSPFLEDTWMETYTYPNQGMCYIQTLNTGRQEETHGEAESSFSYNGCRKELDQVMEFMPNKMLNKAQQNCFDHFTKEVSFNSTAVLNTPPLWLSQP